MPVPEHEPEWLPTGTLSEDLGCPHCGKLCDVCLSMDEVAALDRVEIERLRGALRDAMDHWQLGAGQDWQEFHDARMRALAAIRS